VGVHGTPYCPECGGEMAYDLNTKLYTCKSCGLTLTYQEIMDTKDKNRPEMGEDEKKKHERREYLKWWLSKKEK
jgi:tRNA(Ile2) C34 agmatinyltransferase TiaS